ncbi:MAG: hypothetical protein D6731_19910 [Planctomycetota bacterium]|nr:MAG: hypothetical protein D6731_19910 [Planctomycetota bacterium]
MRIRSVLFLAACEVGLAAPAQADFEQPVTFLQERVQQGRRVSKAKELPQPDVQGYWRVDTDGRQAPFWLKLTGVEGGRVLSFHHGRGPRFFRDLAAWSRHGRGEDFAGVVGQFRVRRHPTRAQAILLEGLFRVGERVRPGEVPGCPDLFWWMPATLTFAEKKEGLVFAGRIDGKEVVGSGEACALGPELRIPLRIARHRGVRFRPAFAGRYIHTLTVGAPASFAAEVDIEWNYADLEGPSGGLGGVSIRRAPGSAEVPRVLHPSKEIHGTYRYRFEVPGVHHIVVDVLDAQGKKLFSDRLVVDLR